MPILYVDSSTGCGFFLSWPCVPTPNVCSGIWDYVESYVTHMILTRRLRITFMPKVKLTISKQRVLLHLPPYTYLESATLLFVVRLLSRMLRTLWIQNPAFFKQCILQRPKKTVPGHPVGRTCGISTSKKFGDWKFCILRFFFSSHHTSGLVSTSSTKIYNQETHAEYHTLAACQDEYHPQDSQTTQYFQVHERAAEQLTTHPVRPTDGSRNHQGSAGKSEDEISWWNCLQHVHLLPREHQGKTYAHHCRSTHHQAKGTWRTV